MKDLLNLQNQLLPHILPSGFEDTIRAEIWKAVRPYVDEISTDRLGNLICHRRGTGKKIVIDAQMDTAGFVINAVDQLEKVFFVPVGEIDESVLEGKRLCTENGTCGKVEKLAKCKNDTKLFCSSYCFLPEGKDADIAIGSPLRFSDEGYRVDGSNVYAANLSGICGSLIVLAALPQISSNKDDLFFVFSTHSEVGLRGIRSAVYRINPDYYLHVSGTAATKNTDLGNLLQCGHGPVISFKGEYVIWDREVVDILLKAAEYGNVECQYKVAETNRVLPYEVSIQAMKSGVASGEIAVPITGMRSGEEHYDMMDIIGAAKLLKTVLEIGFTNPQVE